jgi:uncharacterized protein (DUF58 family)
MAAAMSRLFAPLLARAERRLPALTRLRRPEPLPIALDRKRIYIVPTVFGFGFAAILLVMLLGALNYANNAALLLTCLLGAVAINSMLQAYRALDGLRLVAIHAGTAQTGTPLPLELHFDGGGRAHPALQLSGWGEERFLDVAAEGITHIALELPTHARGWMALPRLRIASTWPFGWFRAWSWLAPSQHVLVYPRPERGGPPPPPAAGGQSTQRREHGDEWSSLRDYQSGDALRQIAWKASARSDTLRVKTFDQAEPLRTWHLKWSATTPLGREARIARLARWVGEAHRAGRAWSLHLPAANYAEGSGEAHYHRCLRALAELP